MVHAFTSTRTLLRIAFWCVLLAAVSYTTADPDLWGHLRFGLDILRDATVAHVDPYSFSADRPWINHEWAAEVMTATAFRLGGNPGLIVLKISAVAAALALLMASLRARGVGGGIDRDLLAAGAVLGTLEQTHHLRPQLFSVVCFSVLLWCLTTATGGRTRWRLSLVPVLFLFWANLHGGWMVGGAVLALWTAGLTIRGARTDASWCALAGALALGATLVNPYGFGLWRFLYETVGFGRADITDWQPVYALAWDAWARWAIVLTLGLAGVASTTRAERRVEAIGVLAALAVASFMVVRLLAFFALSVLYLFGPALSRSYRLMRAEPAHVDTGARRSPLIALPAVITILLAASLVVVNATHLRIDPRFTPDPGAVEFLKRQPPSKRLLVWFDWGEYAIWHLSPAMHVSIDGRRETVYSARLQDQHLRFYFDAPGGAELPRALAADYVWIPRDLPAVKRLEGNGWRKGYEDRTSVIFVRAGLAVAEGAPAAAAANPAVFPGT